MSNFWDNQEIICEVEKNKREKVVASKCERQGKTYLDCRIYANKDGEYIPTAKGFNLELDKSKTFLTELLENI